MREGVDDPRLGPLHGDTLDGRRLGWPAPAGSASIAVPITVAIAPAASLLAAVGAVAFLSPGLASQFLPLSGLGRLKKELLIGLRN
ncbi:MAG: hypothetical protein NTY18_14420, partial [Deltaproteobacteria bacterium]|nr:hypothetical protein [Deltaproteobacteria bacterium]